MEIKIKKLNEHAKIPLYAHKTDAGADLFSLEDVDIMPRTRALIPTGIAMEIPEGYVGLIWDKSGIAVKSGVTTLAGVVDSGYRGEVKVALFNTSDESYKIEKGHKIAQILFQKVESPEFTEVDELAEADRGESGFGSTGIK